MKFSVNWLREFVELPASIDRLTETLTLAGVEIEGVEKRGGNFDNVVVAQINASSQHPNADRLSVCEVDDGSGQPRQIVCGAKNYKVGDKVPLALPGAALPNGLKIKASKLRGVESQGMLCSPSELKMSADSDGLLILSPDARVGAPLASIFPANTILDVEITPNRADLLSHFGLAREIAALTSSSAQMPAVTNGPPMISGSVQISAMRECPFYSARPIRNVKVGASPEWLRTKLEAAGLRAINNIVDITNFVMLELGQPLHAFDADKLDGNINVRLASDGEKFLALDGKTYSLGESNLVIADAKRAVAIAGVMGGEDTGVTETTRNVLLESAYFVPSSVRRTARTLNLPSDSSYRFERGVDPGMILRASQRATELISEIAGGEPADQLLFAGEIPPAPANVSLRYSRADQLIGTSVGQSEADRILKGFGLTEADRNGDSATWKIPSYREDLQREVDLIEEIVRVFGIARVAGTDRSQFTESSQADRTYDAESNLRERLIASGLTETRTSALISRAAIAAGFGKGAAELRNPLSEDHVALRPSLIPGLLAALERNVRAGATSVRLFEVGRVFSPDDATEQKHLALLLCGDAESTSHWRAASKRRLDLSDLKGAIESVRSRGVSFRRAAHPEFALAVEVLLDSEPIGTAGQIAVTRSAALSVTSPVLTAEIRLSEILSASTHAKRFSEMDKFPSVTRDISMIVPDSVTHEEIYELMFRTDENLLKSVTLFDQLIGSDAASKFGAGRKSLAYSLTYRAKDRTLTNDEVTVVHTRIRERLKSEVGAELRE